MDIVDEFKSYCRDHGQYNVTELNQAIKLWDQFEAERKEKAEKAEVDVSTDDDLGDELPEDLLK